MPKNDDPWKRLREKEDAKEAETAKKMGVAPTARQAFESKQQAEDPLMLLADQANVLIEQINNLYNLYVAGIERLPPTEKRKQLDTMMQQIQTIPKMTQGARFRANNIAAHFVAYRDRWERTMRDLESGKIKRRQKA